MRKASDRLGFRANKVAKALRSKSTHTIGLLVPNITYPFFPQLIQAVETELRIDGRGLLLADSLNDATLEAERIEDLLDRQVDGLIVIPCHRRESQSTLLRASRLTNVVQLDREASPYVDFVGMDHALAMRMLLDHLVSTGRSRFAYLGANPTSSASHERQGAYLRHFKGKIDATRVLLGDFSFDWGVEGTLRVVQTWPEVDAIVCGNDLIAVGALYSLAEMGVEVPRQVAVTGFDDSLHPLMRWPAPTTVRQPLKQMALTRFRCYRKRAVLWPACGCRESSSSATRASRKGCGCHVANSSSPLMQALRDGYAMCKVVIALPVVVL